MSEAVQTQTATNEIFDQVMEEIPKETRTAVEDALIAYNKPSVSTTDDESKSLKLRQAFDALFSFLVDNKLNRLNNMQKIFISTGALGDNVTVAGSQGQPVNVPLIPRETYDKLSRALLQESSSLGVWADTILSLEDKFKFIGLGELDPMDLDRGPVRPKKKAAEDEAKLRDELIKKRAAALKESHELVQQLAEYFKAFQSSIGLDALKMMRESIDSINSYLEFASSPRQLSAREMQYKITLEDKVNSAGTNVSGYAEKMEAICKGLKELGTGMDAKISEFRQAVSGLTKLEGGKSNESKRNQFVSFDKDKLRIIKKDHDVISSIIVRGANTSALRMPYSASRILLDQHTGKNENPAAECYCTPANVAKALQKITKVHVNLFSMDMQGNPITPPILIEPIRNFVEWYDDRFVMSFVSGEVGRKGPKNSFSPVDMQVLRVCGLYLAKDPIYNYRGEQNVGTFMGDYAGQVEKKAAVKWSGENKKMTVVSVGKMVDEAGRDDAVKDYMEFLFAMANDYPIPSKISQRKVNIFFNYVVIETPEKTAGLILRYVLPAQGGAGESKSMLFKLAGQSYDEAKKLVAKAYEDPNVQKQYREGLDVLTGRIFGRD